MPGGVSLLNSATRRRVLTLCAAVGLLLVSCWQGLCFAQSAPGVRVQREPVPDPARREQQDVRTTYGANAPTVQRSAEGMEITPPVKSKSPLLLERTQAPNVAGDLDALNAGWELLNAGKPKEALDSFNAAATSGDVLISREAQLGGGYAQWRLGHEAQAEAVFKDLVARKFRTQEVLPNLLLLLRKRGGPKAVEPYLSLLPEEERAAWRK